MKQKPEKIVLASGNKKKVAELEILLKPLSIAIIPQSELNIADADETGLSFVENAIIKARHASLKSGLPAIADDSGIEVDALNGEPGIYSARFFFQHAADKSIADYETVDIANNQFLLEKMKNIPDQQRSARFQCVLVYLRHAADPVPLICHGSWDGKILYQPEGRNGFGYDPLFYVPTHHCSAAELTAEEKAKISHRGQAMHQLLEKFHRLYG